MIIEIGKSYKDRKGNVWKVTCVTSQRIAPVIAERWVGKQYRQRTFQLDGRYFTNLEDSWDLIESA